MCSGFVLVGTRLDINIVRNFDETRQTAFSLRRRRQTAFQSSLKDGLYYDENFSENENLRHVSFAQQLVLPVKFCLQSKIYVTFPIACGSCAGRILDNIVHLHPP